MKDFHSNLQYNSNPSQSFLPVNHQQRETVGRPATKALSLRQETQWIGVNET